jgi:hypothetical protein
VRGLVLAASAVLLAAQPVYAGDQEQLYGTTLDERTVLAFKVSDNVVQKMLPDGWQIDAPAAGPSKGANLSVVLVDQILALDPEGKRVDAVRGAALVVPAKKAGMEKSVAMVIGGLFSPASYSPGPYGNFASAKADVERKIHNGPSGAADIEETWKFATEAGDAVQVQLRYTRGEPLRAKVEGLVYSALRPDFYRIYRYEQATDVARSTPTGVDRVQQLAFTASGQRLSPFFDGSEQLVSVTSIPFYSRQIYLPAAPAAASGSSNKQ